MSRGARALASASAALVTGRIVGTAALGLASVLAARELGPAGRGVLAVEVTVSTLLAILLTGGVYLVARVTLVSTGDDRLDLGHYLGLCLAITAVQGLLCALATVTVLPIAGVHLSVAGGLTFVAHGAATSAALLALNLAYTYGRFVQGAVGDVLGSLSALGVTVWLTTRTTASPVAYLAALVIGALVQAASTFALLEHHPRPRIALDAWRTTIRNGLSGTGVGVAQAATYRFDRYLVGLLATPTAAGLYSVAATGAELIRLVPSALGQIALRHTAEAGRRPPDHRRIRATAVGLTGLACGVALVLAPWALRVALGPRYASSADALRLLLVAEVFTASFLVDSAVLAGLQRLGTASSISLVGFGVITALDLAVIPHFGIAGAAFASILAYAVMAGLAARSLSRSPSAPPPREAGGAGSPAG